MSLAVTAAVLPTAAPAFAHDPVEWQGHTYRVVLHSKETGGAVGMLVTEFPGGDGPPLHVHDDADETFYVLSGEVVFAVGDQRVRARGRGRLRAARR